MTAEERSLLLRMSDDALLRQCRFSARLGSGRGGQKINKTSSSVRIAHCATGLTAECSEERSQYANRRIALKKLRMLMALTIRIDDDPPFELEPVPSIRNESLRLPWLARLCDVLARERWNVARAARALGSSPSKLEKILKRDPELWRCVRESQRKECSVSGNARQDEANSPEERTGDMETNSLKESI